MRFLGLVALLAASTVLAGCNTNDHSTHAARRKCVRMTGSSLCQDEQDAQDSLSGAGDPGVQVHSTRLHD